MPILKMEGRIWHLAKMLNKPESWIENTDLGPFPEVKRKKKEMSRLPHFVWVAEDSLVLGYRPYGLFAVIAGSFALVNFVVDFISFMSSGDVVWFWSFLVSLLVGVSMIYYGIFSRPRRYIAFDRGRGLVHFSRPISGSYISVPWKDAHFVKVRWHIPNIWKAGKSDEDALYFLSPPFSSPRSYWPSFLFRRQMICPGYEPDEQWWMILHFMCHGPGHHKNMAKMLADRQENCDACFNGDMKAMQYFVGTKIKMLSHGAGKFERPFTYGKEWKHLDMDKLPQAPTHVIGPDSKWKKLKKHERDDHVPGPAWEFLTPEQAAVIFEGEEKGKKSGDRKAS